MSCCVVAEQLQQSSGTIRKVCSTNSTQIQYSCNIVAPMDVGARATGGLLSRCKTFLVKGPFTELPFVCEGALE